MLSIIPMKSKPNQAFHCKVPIDDKNITLYFEARYNEVAGYWVMSVSRGNKEYYLRNMPVVPAENMLEQLAYLEIGSAYIVSGESVKDEWPNEYTLGASWYLVWGDTK